jgi:hypothetical protein
MDNVAVAHLLLERSLLESPAKVGGRAFTVTDPNPPIQMGDIYRALSALTSFHIIHLPAVVMLIAAHVVEFYCLAPVFVPILGKLLPRLEPPVVHLQPAMLNVANSHQFANNDEIEKELGYKGIYTSLEGICTEVRDWVNQGGPEEAHIAAENGNTLKGNVEKLATVPASIRD